MYNVSYNMRYRYISAILNIREVINIMKQAKRAEIDCVCTCRICGSFISRLYKNHETISVLKTKVRDWKCFDGIGNVCPECYEDLKSKPMEEWH